MTVIFRNVLPRKKSKSIEQTFEFKRSDYDETYKIPRKIMRFVGIRMSEQLTPLASKCWSFFYWFEFYGVVMAFVVELMSAIETARGGSFQDAIKIFRMLPCMGFVVLGITKSYSIVVHRSVYENLVTEIGGMWPKDKLGSEEHNIVSDGLKQLLFIIKGYYWCNNALMISFLGPPVLEAFKRALGYDNEMLLPFFYWLPFNPFQPVYIDIVMVVQTWQASVVVLFNLSGDVLLCAFLGHITIQFDLLSLKIQRLVYVPVDRQLVETYPLAKLSKESTHDRKYNISEDNNWEETHRKELGQIIATHGTLIRLSEDVERMFSFSLLVTFFNSSIIICFCGFCCILVEKWNEIAYKSFLLTALSETYLICWYGQKLLDSSAGVSHALYNCGWYQASRKIRSSILIMLHRAQKHVRITTYGFSVISSESYTKIIKSAWSYFTLLINIYT